MKMSKYCTYEIDGNRHQMTIPSHFRRLGEMFSISDIIRLIKEKHSVTDLEIKILWVW